MLTVQCMIMWVSYGMPTVQCMMILVVRVCLHVFVANLTLPFKTLGLL